MKNVKILVSVIFFAFLILGAVFAGNPDIVETEFSKTVTTTYGGPGWHNGNGLPSGYTDIHYEGTATRVQKYDREWDAEAEEYTEWNLLSDTLSFSGAHHTQNYNYPNPKLQSVDDHQHGTLCEHEVCGFRGNLEDHDFDPPTFSGNTIVCNDGCGHKSTSHPMAEAAAALQELLDSSDADTKIADVQSKMGEVSGHITDANTHMTDGNTSVGDAEKHEEDAEDAFEDAEDDRDDAKEESDEAKDQFALLDIPTTENQLIAAAQADSSICPICGTSHVSGEPGPLTGNPVNIMNGSKYEGLLDLEITDASLPIQILRTYNNQDTIAGSFGQGWSFSYDSRILFGTTPGIEGALATARQNLTDAQGYKTSAQTYINSAVSQYNAAGDDYTLAKDFYDDMQEAYELAVAALSGDGGVADLFTLLGEAMETLPSSVESDVEGSAAAAELQGYINTYNTLDGEATEEGSINELVQEVADLLTDINTNFIEGKKWDAAAASTAATTAYTAATHIQTVSGPALLLEIQGFINSINDQIDFLEEQLVIAEAQEARNIYVSDSQNTSQYEIGNDFIMWIGLDGVEYIFEANTPADGDSTSTIATGITNVWPAGTTFTALYGNRYTAEAIADGSFLVFDTDRNIEYTYNKYGRLTSVSDLTGAQITVEFNGRRLEKISDSYGRWITAVTASNGQIESLTDFSGRTVSYDYTGRFLTSFTDAGSYTYGYGYDPNGNLDKWVQPDLEEKSYVYTAYPIYYTIPQEALRENTLTRAVALEEAAEERSRTEYRVTWEEDEDGYYQTFDYNIAAGTTTHYNREQQPTTYKFENNRITEVHTPDGETIINGYEIDRYLISQQAANGYTTTFVNDEHGHPEVTNLPTGGTITQDFHSKYGIPVEMVIDDGEFLSATEFKIYETGVAAGKIEEIHMPNPLTGLADENLVQAFTYDNKGRLHTITDTQDVVTTISYSDLYPASGSTVTVSRAGSVQLMTLDALGRVYQIDQEDTRQVMEYDDLGRVIKITQVSSDVENIITEYTYNFRGLDLVIGPYYESDAPVNQNYFYLPVTDYDYDDRGNVQYITTTEQGVSSQWYFVYDRENRRTLSRDPDGREQIVRYTVGGKVWKTGFTDEGRNRFLTEYLYDSNGRIDTIFERGKPTIDYTYISANETQVSYYGGELVVTQILDDLGRVKSIEQYSSVDGTLKVLNDYDGAGRLETRTLWRDSLDATESFIYDSEGRLKTYTDLRGYEFGYDYDALGRLEFETGPEGMHNTYGYDDRGNLNLITDATGKGTDILYNDLGRIQKVTYADNSYEEYTYDARGRILTLTDRQNALTSIAYDPTLRQRTVTNHENVVVLIERYNASGQLIYTEDAENAVTEYRYHSETGALEETIYPDKSREKLHWSDVALLDSIEEISANEEDESRFTHFLYDSNNFYRLYEVLKPGGLRYGYEYDYAGRLREITQIGVNGTEHILRSFAYRIDGSLKSESYILDGELFTKRYETDITGLVTEIHNFRQMPMYFDYDGLGRQSLADYGNGEVYDLSYRFELGMSVLDVTGPDGYDRSYYFDPLGQLTEEINNVNSESWTYEYTAGLMTQSDGPGNQDRISYDYDILGRLERTRDQGSEEVEYLYDDRNLLTTILYGSSDRSVTEQDYDLMGRMTSTRTIKNWGSHDEATDGAVYLYDGFGNLQTEARYDGTVLSYLYDDANRISDVFWSENGSDRIQAARHERSSLGLSSSESGFDRPSYQVPSVLSSDEASDLETLWDEQFADYISGGLHLPSTMLREEYEYDGFGRLSEKNNPLGSINYAYDMQGRVQQAGFRAYDYDADGNRTNEYFTDQAIQPEGVSTQVVANTTLHVPGFNNNGNGNGRGTAGAAGSPWAQEDWSVFEYRADNRLAEYSDSQGEEWAYRYDAFGRRFEKERLSSATSDKDVYRSDEYYYLGLSHTVLEERTDFEYWNDKTTQTGARFLIGPGGRTYASIETYVRHGHEWNPSSWANRRYYHYDRLGSVSSASLDKPGLSGDNYDYSTFGMQIAGNTRYQWEDNGNQFMGFEHIGFTGQRTDYESGNIHFPFREYDPLSASWTTEDPIKDDQNWYVYVSNNPINRIDPLGLEWRQLGTGWLNDIENVYFDADEISVGSPGSEDYLWLPSFGQGPGGEDIYIQMPHQDGADTAMMSIWSDGDTSVGNVFTTITHTEEVSEIMLGINLVDHSSDGATASTWGMELGFGVTSAVTGFPLPYLIINPYIYDVEVTGEVNIANTDLEYTFGMNLNPIDNTPSLDPTTFNFPGLPFSLGVEGLTEKETDSCVK